MQRNFYYWYFLDEPEPALGKAGRRYAEDFIREKEIP